MSTTKKLFLTALALAGLSAGGWAQTGSASSKPTSKKKHAAVAGAQPAVTAADVQSLRDALAAQQQQIQQLRDELQHRDQSVQQAESAAADAATKADAAQAQATQQQQAVGDLKTDVADLKTNVSNTALSVQETQKNLKAEIESPNSFHFRGITITPAGFAAAEFVRRSRALGADIPTPFNSLTMPGASQSHASEFFGSARQTRPSMFVEGRFKNVDLLGYVSADFLSAGVTSTSTQTNSYTLRLRQAWGQAKFQNGWSFLGGQMWSLVTENRAGIGPSDDVGKVNDARPSTIDPGYNVGFTFARQYALRLTKDFGDKVWFAISMENAQATLTTHGNGDNFLLGEAGASNSYNTTSNYSFNPSPDVVAKLAFDPGFGHYEVFGLLDRFSDRVFPCGEVASITTLCGGSTAVGPNSLGAYSVSKNGGGVGANARWTFADKRFIFGVHGFGGSGVGRYGAGQLSDVSIRANGTLALIKNYQGLGTLEWRGKKLDLYLYGGTEYAQRTADFDLLTGKQVGYGASLFNNSGCYTEIAPPGATGFTPGALSNCTSDTRALIEGTGGLWYRFFNGPNGKLQFGAQYSYLTRQTWSGMGFTKGTGVSPAGVDNMVFTSFRYYLP